MVRLHVIGFVWYSCMQLHVGSIISLQLTLGVLAVIILVVNSRGRGGEWSLSSIVIIGVIIIVIFIIFSFFP